MGKDIIPLCRELNIGFVAFSPMGNGFLSGKYKPTDRFEGDDVRRVITRFSPENMEANMPLLDLMQHYAARKNRTPIQISLALVLNGGDFIVPIPGMRSESRIAENLGAADIKLTGGVLTVVVLPNYGKTGKAQPSDTRHTLLWQLTGIVTGCLTASIGAIYGRLGICLGSAVQASTVSFMIAIFTIASVCIRNRTIVRMRRASAKGNPWWI